MPEDRIKNRDNLSKIRAIPVGFDAWVEELHGASRTAAPTDQPYAARGSRLMLCCHVPSCCSSSLIETPGKPP